MTTRSRQDLPKVVNLRIGHAAVAVALAAACQSPEKHGQPKAEEAPSSSTFVGRWKYESEAVNQECQGKELVRDPQQGRTVEFVERGGQLTLASETCRIPLVVNGSVASSNESSACPWVDGMTVTMSSVRAELRSTDRAQLVTQTQILGKHPQFPEDVFDCTATSSGLIMRVK